MKGSRSQLTEITGMNIGTMSYHHMDTYPCPQVTIDDILVNLRSSRQKGKTGTISVADPDPGGPK